MLTPTQNAFVHSVSDHASSLTGSTKRSASAARIAPRSRRSTAHSAASVTKPKTATGPSPPNKRPRVQPTCCTVPVSVVFAGACFFIAAALGVNCAVSGVEFQEHVTQSVRNEVSSGLEGVVLAIRGTFAESVTIATEFQLMIESNPNKYACDDAIPSSFPGNTSNANFLEAAAMYALPKTNLVFIYQVRNSRRFVYADGTPVPLLCAVEAYSQIFYYFANRTVSGARFINASDVQKLRSLPVAFNVPYDIRNSALATNPRERRPSTWPTYRRWAASTPAPTRRCTTSAPSCCSRRPPLLSRSSAPSPATCGPPARRTTLA